MNTQQQIIKLLTLLSIIFIDNVVPYPTGVPGTDEICQIMTPKHGPSPQTTVSPYKLEVAQKRVGQDETVEVFLTGGQTTFKGYYVQARNDANEPIGSFTPTSDDQKVHNCGTGKRNAIFHGVRGEKNNIKVYWTSPKDFVGNVVFTATFVQEFDHFWTQVKSSPVNVRLRK